LGPVWVDWCHTRDKYRHTRVDQNRRGQDKISHKTWDPHTDNLHRGQDWEYFDKQERHRLLGYNQWWVPLWDFGWELGSDPSWDVFPVSFRVSCQVSCPVSYWVSSWVSSRDVSSDVWWDVWSVAWWAFWSVPSTVPSWAVNWTVRWTGRVSTPPDPQYNDTPDCKRPIRDH